MKKTIAMLLVLIMAVSVMAVAAAAAGETYTIHVDVSEAGWSELYVYYWGAEGPSWPGEATTATDNDGWYTYQVPVGAQGLVLNNGAGTQTVDLTSATGMLMDQECWVVVKAEQDGGKNKFACSATKPVDGEELSPVVPDAPTLNYVAVTGTGLTANTWDPADATGKMELVSENVYSITFPAVAAGTACEIKFTANGGWSDLDLGGAYAGSGLAADAVWGGSNITFTVEQTNDVTITLDLTGFDYSSKSGAKFTISIGAQQDEPAPTIKIHVSAPADWAEVYAYTYNPEQVGSWPGTKVENGVIEVTADFEGFIVNNNANSQTVDIKDIDLTKKEVWLTVGAAGEDGKYGYSLRYTAPNSDDTGDMFGVVIVMMLVSAMGVAALVTHKARI